jgi:uncharacterized protein (TIGR04222 family)
MNLNPFDLRGPEFLVFYVVLSAATVAALRIYRWWRESQDLGSERAAARDVAQDPYQVAFLRGGRDEVLRIAVVSLIERGLLEARGDKLAATDPEAAGKARRALDKAILTKFADEGTAQSLYSDDVVLGEADVIGDSLARMGLLPDEAVKTSRVALAVAGTAFLWLVALIKIAVALSRGRTNILFLVVLAIAVPFVMYAVLKRPRTALGNAVYTQVRDVFSSLSSRRDLLELNQTTSELTYLAAAFGLAALPVTVLAALPVAVLKLQRPQAGHAGWGSCSASSCSGGSSCGGGGGCGGGGCGGCGG